MASSSFTPLGKANSHSILMTDKETSKVASLGARMMSGSTDDAKDSKSDTDMDDEDEDENKKRELLRLLGTATDEDRRSVVLSALAALESKNKRIASVSHLMSEAMPIETHPSAGFVKSLSSHSFSNLVSNTGGGASSSGNATIAIAEGKSAYGDDDDDDRVERKMKENPNFSSSSSNSSGLTMGSSSSAHRLPVVMDDYKDDYNDVYSTSDKEEDYSIGGSSSAIGSNAAYSSDRMEYRNGNVRTLAMTRAIGMGGGAGNIGLGINRPMSARLRRPSLDIIPENRRFNLRTYEKGKELELEEGDISDVCASSHDHDYPPSSSLLNQHSHKIGWISTGLVPQVMSINLSSLWVFRKIVVKCLGVESMKLSVPGTANMGIPMEKLNANEFIFDVRVTQLPLQIKSTRKHSTEIMTSDSSDLDLIWGNQVVLTFTKSSSQFVAVINLKIVVVPFIHNRDNDSPSTEEKKESRLSKLQFL